MTLLQVAPPAPPSPDQVLVQQFPPFPHGTPAPWEVLPAPVFVLIVLGVVAGAVVILWPLVRAIARRIEGRGQDPAVLEELDHLRTRVADLEAHQGRMNELEERMDFAERLLARKAEPREIGP